MPDRASPTPGRAHASQTPSQTCFVKLTTSFGSWRKRPIPTELFVFPKFRDTGSCGRVLTAQRLPRTPDRGAPGADVHARARKRGGTQDDCWGQGRVAPGTGLWGQGTELSPASGSRRGGACWPLCLCSHVEIPGSFPSHTLRPGAAGPVGPQRDGRASPETPTCRGGGWPVATPRALPAGDVMAVRPRAGVRTTLVGTLRG